MRKPIRLTIMFALFATLLAPLSGEAGRLVCARGMTQAGAACPLCHTSVPDAKPHADGTPGPCCRFVALERHAGALPSTVDIGAPRASSIAYAEFTPGSFLLVPPGIDSDPRGDPHSPRVVQSASRPTVLLL